MSAILTKLRHRRTAMGFGVHSPFAFRFITEVLRPAKRYGYYAYSVAGKDPAMRLLVRLLSEFNPSTVSIHMRRPDRAGAVVRAVCPDAEIVVENADFVISDTEIVRLMPCNALVISRNVKPLIGAVQCRLEYGMTFTDCRRYGVVVAMPHLPRQDFELSLC